MTPTEHETQRCMVWIEAMKGVLTHDQIYNDNAVQTADHVLSGFDKRFPAPVVEPTPEPDQ